MTSVTTSLATAAVLADARRAQVAAEAAQLRVLEAAVEWAGLHEVTDPDDAATWGDSPVPLAGSGAPLIASFCVSEFSACLGLSDFAGRALLADGVEMRHRLPRLWERTRAAKVKVWHARRVAERTIALSPEAAAHVDAQVAAFASRISIAALERLIDEAVARFMPDRAAEIAARAADGRHVTVRHDQVSFAGTSRIEGELDLRDAIDLERALQSGAQLLADLGCDLPLDSRRSVALGHLARGEDILPISDTGVDTARSARRGSRVVLYVHLSEEALGTHGAVGRVENAGTHLVTAEQVRDWCGATDHLTVTPVLDLQDQVQVGAYEIPDRMRDQVILRERACAFPWCERSARRCDLDHVIPYDRGGATSSDNLASC
jgi:hypothetical protein